MSNFNLKQMLAPSASLFLSAGTLVCCALPALFVSLGMGATLAGFLGAFPQIIWLSKYKIIVFSVAALMLTIAGIMQWRARNMACPIDPAQAKACKRMRKISWLIYGFSVLIFLTGAFFAFAAKYVLL